MLKLIRPTIDYETQVMDYRNEFINNGDDMAGTSFLRNYECYKDWLEFVEDNENEKTKRTEVTASVFLAIRENDDLLVGIVNIRHALNDYLFKYGGHIGYSVSRNERRKGYAKEILRLALIECEKINLRRVLVACDASNIASAKTIKYCGGVLENEVYEDKELVQRYWINL